jgi:hypothetical protein
MSTSLPDREPPDWAIKGRVVRLGWRKRREAKRARRFITVGWAELTTAMYALRIGRVARLYLTLHLHARLKTTQTRDGWIELFKHELDAAGLADSHLSRDVTRLESVGLIEVQRRLGKRPLVRLIEPGGDP